MSVEVIVRAYIQEHSEAARADRVTPRRGMMRSPLRVVRDSPTGDALRTSYEERIVDLLVFTYIGSAFNDEAERAARRLYAEDPSGQNITEALWDSLEVYYAVLVAPLKRHLLVRAAFTLIVKRIVEYTASDDETIANAAWKAIRQDASETLDSLIEQTKYYNDYHDEDQRPPFIIDENRRDKIDWLIDIFFREYVGAKAEENNYSNTTVGRNVDLNVLAGDLGLSFEDAKSSLERTAEAARATAARATPKPRPEPAASPEPTPAPAWPSEKWKGSPEELSRKQHAIVAFLRRVWVPFIDENNVLVTRAMLSEHDAAAAAALKAYVRGNGLPSDIRIVRGRDLRAIAAGRPLATPAGAA